MAEKKERKHILLVDDEQINREILGNIVSTEYEVTYAGNGREALDILHEHKQRISLILLDLLMPEMGGFAFLDVARADDELRQIPVIVLTSERSAEVSAIQAGAVDFIPKPYDAPEVILARIRRSIELYENSFIIQATEKDELTGLYTRDYFFEYAKQYDEYHADEAMDAIVFNINHFHLVNELYGRTFADLILQKISMRIYDILSREDGIAARCEADTFYLYLPHQKHYDDVLDFIMEGLSDIPKTSRVHLRMGIYPSVDKSIHIERIFDRAVLACNSLRNNYSSFVAVYNAEMYDQEIYDERLISDTDAAMEQKQFQVYYQPKFNIKGDKPVLSSAEALIRWHHPELGMVRPGAFIPLFEENGLVQKLDHFVWHEAAAQIKKWKDEYGITIPVSVNVSRIDIYNPNLEEELLEIVKENGISPHDYLLEVTESAYTDNSDQIVEVVDRLRADGFRVEMDDFGSGYSSLNMLTALPIDALKLDMVFVQNIKPGSKEYRMVELMMDIAEFLKVPVIAEGVENEEQYKLLKEAGCDIIQGFYFSRPVPPEEFETFIKDRVEQEKGVAK